MKYIMLIIMSMLLVNCSNLTPRRIFLDSSLHKDAAPSWTTRLDTSWKNGNNLVFKTTYAVRGDERVNGCYDMAKLDLSEKVLTEIVQDVRGSIDNAFQSISEEAEIILGKVRTGEFEGRITGLKVRELYFERYLTDMVERIDCHVLAEISVTDYHKTKQNVLYKVIQVDPKLREAITAKQVQFFKKGE